MPAELNAFKSLLLAWLTDMEGMAALVGRRVYCGRPMQPPGFPMITFHLQRRPLTDYPQAAWQGTAALVLHATDADRLDAIEAAVTDALAGGAPEPALSDASVICACFALQQVDEDEFEPSAERGSLGVLRRRMAFHFIMAARGD
jgi:hypothetical protein